MTDPVRFYADVHLPFPLVATLRRRGLDVVTSQEAKMTTASDPEQLAFAASARRAMLTQDRDYLRLHAVGYQHAGVIYLRQRRGGIGDMAAAVAAIAELGVASVKGALFFR